MTDLNRMKHLAGLTIEMDSARGLLKEYGDMDADESVQEAGGYYTQPVYDMIEKHGYEKVMRKLLTSLDADVIQDFISRADLDEATNEDYGRPDDPNDPAQKDQPPTKTMYVINWTKPDGSGPYTLDIVDRLDQVKDRIYNAEPGEGLPNHKLIPGVNPKNIYDVMGPNIVWVTTEKQPQFTL